MVQLVCRRIEDVNGVLAELQKTRAILSSRTAFVLETLIEKGAFGELDESLLPEEGRLAVASYRRFLPWIALFTIYVVWGSTYLAIAIAVKECLRSSPRSCASWWPEW
jgi:hypothetical protein